MSLHPEALRTQSLEVADIFRAYGELYRTAYDPPLLHLKVLSAIARCRTEALGGHLDECDTCGYQPWPALSLGRAGIRPTIRAAIATVPNAARWPARDGWQHA